MKFVLALPLAFVLATTAFPQNPGEQFSSEIFRANCPMELKATFITAGGVMPITPVARGQKIADTRQFGITLSNPNSEVISARITIYGFPVGERTDPGVLYFPHNPAEIKKTIALERTVEVGKSTSYEVSIPNFSTVTSIDLDSVAYSDGTSWHPAAGGSCRAVPLPIKTL